MSKLSEFHKKWKEQQLHTPESAGMAKKILEEYPWFTPARLVNYMHESTGNASAGYPPLQHFSYNPMRYYDLLPENNELPVPAATVAYQDAPIVEDDSNKDTLDSLVEASQTDFFDSQGVSVSTALPELEELIAKENVAETEATDTTEADKHLMVMMSFSEWLSYLSKSKKAAEEEAESKSALKAHWQKQKLSEALEEEHEEVPAAVFEMAMSSIQDDDELITESMAMVLAQQGKQEKAVEMYRKLSLKFPEKSHYFAAKIDKIRNPLA